MKRIVLSMLLGLGAFVQSANANIIANVDTSSELSGTFSITSSSSSLEYFTPVNFVGFLPGPLAVQSLVGERQGPNGLTSPSFLGTFYTGLGSNTFGSPNDPIIVPNHPSVTGSYNNDPNHVLVDFTLNGSDTGGSGGTWSGTFSFKVQGSQPATGVADSGSTGGLLGATLIGSFILRKKLGLVGA